MKIKKRTWQYVGLVALTVAVIVAVAYVLFAVPSSSEIIIPGF